MGDNYFHGYNSDVSSKRSLTLDKLQLSLKQCKLCGAQYLSPTPVGVGVETSLIWAVDQTLPSGESLVSCPDPTLSRGKGSGDH